MNLRIPIPLSLAGTRRGAWLPITLLALALAACEGPPPTPPVTLRVGLLRTQDLLPYFVIQEQGLDKKHGLRFEETFLPGGAAAVDALAAGTIDLSPVAGTVPLLAAADRGLIPDKLVPIAANNIADPKHPGTGVVVAHSVNGWKDLEGKKIGINAAVSITTASMDIRLKREGVKGYSFVEIPFANMGLAVAGGNVAAAAMSEPHLTQSLLRGDGKLLDWVIGGPPFERMAFTSIVFSAELYRHNPQAVKAYLRAHLAAVKWINDRPADARLLLARRLNLTAEVGERINLLHWPLDARPEPALIEQNQRVLVEAGLLKRAVDARALHDETHLSEVLKERR